MASAISIRKKIIAVFSPCAVVIFLDQVTKLIAEKRLSGREPVFLLKDFFVFVFTENQGAFLSLGGNLGSVVRIIIFIVLPLIILFSAVVYLFRKNKLSFRQLCFFSLILGGGLSNVFDRIFKGGEVVDFMNIGIRNIRTGIFNVADLGIVFGAGLLALSFIKEKKTG